MFSIAVQQADFDVGREYQALVEQNLEVGAVVCFVGKVRDMNLAQPVSTLTLEHYPGMTEKSLQSILNQARSRWKLSSGRIVHRVGCLGLGEQIVFVGTTSPHREAAFEAAEFIMDYLKTRAPFWKRECSGGEEKWLDASNRDSERAKRWQRDE